jgi:hypothetical protein
MSSSLTYDYTWFCFCFLKWLLPAWYYTHIIPALGMLRQDYQKFEDSLGYIKRPYIKNISK